MNPPAPSVLVLVPAYNEEQRIEPVLREYAQFFRDNYAGKFTLLVVLNGCRDNTLGVVQRAAAEFPEIEVEDHPDPIGKGGALIEGLRHASRADLIGYVDADGATPPKAFLELIKLTERADCVIGSRWLPGSVLHQKQPRLRRFVSRGFHTIVETFFWMGIKDTQCPAKIMKRAVVEKIHSSLRIADLAFDVNLLYSIKRAGFKTIEVPVEWTDKSGSKVTASLGRAITVMFLSVLRLRLYYSPMYSMLRPLRPLEGWVYKKLKAPPPRSGERKAEKKKDDESK